MYYNQSFFKFSFPTQYLVARIYLYDLDKIRLASSDGAGNFFGPRGI